MNDVFCVKKTEKVFLKNDESRDELLNQLNELNKTYSYE